MKKNSFISFMVLTILLFNLFFSKNAEAKTKSLYVDARSAIALDSKSKCILYERNSDLLIPIASTTKIMTSLVALKYGDLDKKIEISDKAANIHGSQVGYKKGEMITLRELLYGLMLRSGNDAAIAIAEGISGSVEKFCELMNEYAIELGALNSNFESPHGLDSQCHYSTAYDLALITAKAKENDVFNKIVSAKDVEASEYGFTRSYHNINKILYQIPNANGVKTGYTGGAGKCLVTSIKEKNNDIIIVVLNSPKRWNETKKIYDYVKDNYEFRKIITKGEVVDNIVYDEDKKINLAAQDNIIIPVAKEENIKTKIIKTSNLPSEIKPEMALGRLCVYKDENLVSTCILKSDNNKTIRKNKNIIKIIKNILNSKE